MRSLFYFVSVMVLLHTSKQWIHFTIVKASSHGVPSITYHTIPDIDENVLNH